MLFDTATLYKDCFALCQLIDEDSKSKLMGEARNRLQDYYELTLQDVDILINHNYQERKKYFHLPNHITALQHFWLLGFAKFFEHDFIPTLQKLQIPNDLVKSYEKQAQHRLLTTTFFENLLIFSRNYFQLPNFQTALRTTLADLILAFKDNTNQNIFQRAALNIQLKELKSKNHK